MNVDSGSRPYDFNINTDFLSIANVGKFHFEFDIPSMHVGETRNFTFDLGKNYGRVFFIAYTHHSSMDALGEADSWGYGRESSYGWKQGGELPVLSFSITMQDKSHIKVSVEATDYWGDDPSFVLNPSHLKVRLVFFEIPDSL